MMNPKRKGMYRGGIFIGLAVALLLDLKYKGLFYRMIRPKEVQS
ncbi:hypothetical protein [Oceanobacillus alkalisoli]|nr:hypothetical protein [Oceanobacillus alkalisoli]